MVDLQFEFKITKHLGNLVKLVGKNFEDLVVNNENDVFIKFYAPWCGHCKAMAEDWAKLADEYADDQSMVIAEFDATANDTRKFLWTQSDSVEPLTCDLKKRSAVKGFDYTGFPTLFWVPAGDKSNPVKYEGARSIEEWEKYIQENKSGVSRDEL